MTSLLFRKSSLVKVLEKEGVWRYPPLVGPCLKAPLLERALGCCPAVLDPKVYLPGALNPPATGRAL